MAASLVVTVASNSGSRRGYNIRKSKSRIENFALELHPQFLVIA